MDENPHAKAQVRDLVKFCISEACKLHPPGKEGPDIAGIQATAHGLMTIANQMLSIYRPK